MTLKNTELSNAIMAQIGDMIDGNQVSRHDLQPIFIHNENLNVELNVYWTFSGEYRETVVAGRQINGIDHSLRTFEETTEELCWEAAHNHDLQKKALAVIGLPYSKKAFVFHRFEPISRLDNCPDCYGHGECDCPICSGKGRHSCSYCQGRGQYIKQMTVYHNGQQEFRSEYQRCEYCQGMGYNSCGGCAGIGRKTCQRCQGYGEVSYNRYISAVAKSNYQMITNAPNDNDALQTLLNETDFSAYAQHFQFQLKEKEQLSDTHYLFHYQATIPWCEVHFRLKNKEYRCVAFAKGTHSTQAEIYIYPLVFDDLFADELAFLQKSFPNRNAINGKAAMTFFTRYMEQPILNKVMQDATKEGSLTELEISSQLQQHCGKFISPSFADRIGQYLNRIMGKISPTYSLSTWFFFALLGAGFIFASTAMNTEILFPEYVIEPILRDALFSIGIHFVLAIVAWLISSLLIFHLKRKIPTAYRSETNNSKAYLYYGLFQFCVFIIAIGYGYMVSNGSFSSPFSHHYPKACAYIQQSLNGFQSKACYVLAERIQIAKETPEERKIRQIKYINQKLCDEEYDCIEDLTLWNKSRQDKVHIYLARRGHILPRNPTLDDFYQYVKEN